MRIFKSKGFTLVEVIVVIALLAVVAVASGSYMSNSFRDSNNLVEKTDIQNSVTRLINKIENIVKEAEIPVLKSCDDDELFVIKNSKGNTFTCTFDEDEKCVELVEKLNGTQVRRNTYEYIEKIEITQVDDNGINIAINGLGNIYKLSGTYYSRNMNFDMVSYTVVHIFNGEEFTDSEYEETKYGLSGSEINIENERTYYGDFSNAEYDDYDGDTTIKRDGSTVITLYYNRG